MPYQNFIYLPYFLIIARTMQGYVNICKYCQYKILKFEKKYSVVYHIRHFDFQKRIKNIYRQRIKKWTMNNPQPPFHFPIPSLRLSGTSPTKDLMTKFMGFFVPNIRFKVFLSFLGVVIRIYQLE